MLTSDLVWYWTSWADCAVDNRSWNKGKTICYITEDFTSEQAGYNIESRLILFPQAKYYFNKMVIIESIYLVKEGGLNKKLRGFIVSA